MKHTYKIRRTIAIIILLLGFSSVLYLHPELQQSTQQSSITGLSGEAVDTLQTLPVKGRAPKTDYSRKQFGEGWAISGGCDMRNIILNRDLRDAAVNEKCQVTQGVLDDVYTSKTITFQRGADTSADVQIDHVVALSDAWQKGAQQLSPVEREALANDPLELMAVDGEANQQKSDGDAATWLPPNKPFRCQYVARQIAIKKKYRLWVTAAEKSAMETVLSGCPGQKLPSA